MTTTGNGQSDSVCSSQSETTRILTSLASSKRLRAPPNFPFDLVVEILCRLPVKYLIQLRCVCKSWHSLFSRDSNFAKKHLRVSTSNYDRHHLIRITTQSPKELVLCHAPLSSVFSSASSTTSVTRLTYSLGDILNEEEADFDGASTCGGIICVKINNSLAILCNPSIKKFKTLPPLEIPYQSYTSYTLVHGHFTKIIALNRTFSRKQEVNVYILDTDHWRRIQDFPGPNLIPRHSSGTFVNDSVNWLTSSARFIVSLDLEKESYQKLSLPIFHDINSYMILGTLRGCLSLLYDRDELFDVWIMKEYGNEKSWTKLLILPSMEGCHFYNYTKALCISNDGQIVMEFIKNGKFNLVVYDSTNNTFKIPKFQNNILGELMAQEVYVESLISPL